MPAPPLVDEGQLTTLRALLGDGADEVVDLFVEEAGRMRVELRRAARHGDLDRIGRTAHTVKGAAAALGAERLARESGRLERAAEEGTLEDPVAAVAALVDLMDLTVERFEGLRQTGP